MTDLRVFMAPKPKKRAPTLPRARPEPVEDEDRVRQGKPNPARDLYRVYAAIQRQHGQWVPPYDDDKQLRTCFRKVAANLLRYAAQGRRIDPVRLMTSHREVYGMYFRPYHLLNGHAMAIYNEATARQSMQTIHMTNEEYERYDEAILARLSLVHNVGLQTVRALLELGGLR
jgi:hypothetical protein